MKRFVNVICCGCISNVNYGILTHLVFYLFRLHLDAGSTGSQLDFCLPLHSPSLPLRFFYAAVQTIFMRQAVRNQRVRPQVHVAELNAISHPNTITSIG